MSSSLTDLQRAFWGTTDQELATLQALVNAGLSSSDLASSLAQSPLFIGQGLLQIAGGSPATGTIGAAYSTRTRVWLIDAASEEALTTTAVIPPSWTTGDVYLWWVNTVAAAGNVIWRSYINGFADGEDSTVGAITTPDVTVAAPATVGPTRRTLLVANTPLVGDELTRFTVERGASLAGDTLTNDVGVFAFEIVRTT